MFAATRDKRGVKSCGGGLQVVMGVHVRRGLCMLYQLFRVASLESSFSSFTLYTDRHSALHEVCLAAAPIRATGELGVPRRSRAQRRSPLVVRGRLLELRRRARPRLPSAAPPAQHESPCLVGLDIVRRRPHHLRRQRLELLLVPPLRRLATSAHCVAARQVVQKFQEC